MFTRYIVVDLRTGQLVSPEEVDQYVRLFGEITLDRMRQGLLIASFQEVMSNLGYSVTERISASEAEFFQLMADR